MRAIAAIGADASSSGTFTDTTTTATPVCQPGYHWEDDTDMSVRGLGDFSPNRTRRRMQRGLAAISACVPDTTTATATNTLPPAATATAPAAATASCPALWPWWWLAVAAGAGAGVGWYIKTQPKKRANPLGRRRR